MYLKAIASQIAAYPYSLDQLKRDNPNTSFPKELTAKLLAAYNVFKVLETAHPVPGTDQGFDETAPALLNGVWTQQWTVRDLTMAERTARVPRAVTKLQGMLAIAEVGLAEAFLTWKSALDPVADFASLAFLDSAQTWEYDNPLLNAALTALGVEGQKDALFTLAGTL